MSRKSFKILFWIAFLSGMALFFIWFGWKMVVCQTLFFLSIRYLNAIEIGDAAKDIRELAKMIRK